LRRELGTSRVAGKRTALNVKYAPWLSASMLASVFRILAKEMLGYTVRPYHSDPYHSREEAQSESCAAIQFEEWQDWPLNSNVHAQPVGFLGEEHLFMPSHITYTARHYEGLLEPSTATTSAPLDQLVRDGTVGLDNLTAFFPEGSPFGCDPEIGSNWTGNKCNNMSRWYPPQCGDTFPSPNCHEIYIPDQRLPAKSGWWEAVIRNHKLNLSVVYTGTAGLDSILEALNDTDKGFAYWWRLPEPKIAAYRSTPMVLPNFSERCRATYNLDPLLSGVDCDRPTTVLQKVINKEVFRSETDAAYLWQQLSFDQDGIERLLSYHKEAGGPHETIEAASCGWLRENEETWRPWLSINDECEGEHIWTLGGVVCPDGDNSSVLMTGLLIAGCCVLFLLLLVLGVMQCRLLSYVGWLEEPPEKQAVDPAVLDSPLLQAVELLQMVGRGETITKKKRQQAMRTWKHLLKSNLYAPPLDSLSESDFTRGQSHMAELMVQFCDETNRNNTSMMEATDQTRTNSAHLMRLDSRARTSDAQHSELWTQKDEGLARWGPLFRMDLYADPARCLELLDALYQHPQHKKILSQVGQNILQDTFAVAGMDPFVSHRPLFVSSMVVLRRHDLIKELGLDEECMARFLIKVEDGYHNVPYHNRTHAADVVCRVAAMLDAEGFADDGTMVGRIRFLAVLLAAVVHDYDHPGTDNHYQVQSNTMLSRHFNQQSVLENSSLFHTLEMLRDKPTAALASLKDNQEAVIALVIKLVLATDMASHFNIVTNFRTKVVIPLQEMERSGSFNSCERDAAAAGRRHTRSMRLSLGPEHKAHAHHNDKRPSEQNRRQIHDEGPGSPASCSDLSMRSRKGSNGSSPLKGYSGFLKLDEQQQEMALVMALKVADIGHSYAPFNVHLAWSECLQEEFFSQGSKEIEAGRSPGMLKDPSKPGPMDPDTQIGFLNVIALPSTKVWSEVFPTSGLVMLSEGLENRTGWREVADHLHQDKGQEKRPSNEQEPEIGKAEPEIGKAELEIGKAERGTPRALCTVP